MKPTSLIFLALSLILFLGGLMTCTIATSMAEAQGISIFEQSLDDAGDSVYTYDISDDKLSKLTLTFAGVDVTVVGSAERSYVELKNFGVYSYATTLSGSNVTVDGTVGMISSMIDLSGGGIRFKGLRYFLMDKPDPTRQKSVTVYIAKDSELKSVSLSLKQGSVSVKNLDNSIDYSMGVTDGNVVLDSVKTESVVNLNVTNGNIDVTGSSFKTLAVSHTNGNVIVNLDHCDPTLISYNVATENGVLVYNEYPILEGRYNQTTFDPQYLVKIDAKDATVALHDSSTPMQP